jgi:SAM-dependent methyltransferase
MPDLSTQMHLDMWKSYKEQNSFPSRVRKAIRLLLRPDNIYGLEWGDPEGLPPLMFIRDMYVLPHVSPEQVAVEIGAGGGRWTRYLLGFRELYAVDYHAEILTELRKNFDRPNLKFVKNNGCDFPGIAENSVDFVFSFGCFVHLDLPLVETYLKNIKPILKPGGNVLIHYSDKTKIMAQFKPGFSDNTPDRMKQMIVDAGFRVVQEDLTTMWHSSIVIFSH